MVLPKVMLAAAAVAVAAPADISAPHDCFPTNTQTLISDFELRSINMQYGLAQGNDNAGKQAHTEMKDLLDMISGEVNALGNCENHLPKAWPKSLSAEDSKDRALELLQQANKEMELLRDPVAKCDYTGALKKVCDARAVVDEIGLYPGYLNVHARWAANCSWSDYGDTMSLVHRTESSVAYLRNAVEFDNKEDMKTDLGPMNQKFDELSVAVGAGQHGDICGNPRPKPWPKMKSKKSRDHAVELLDSVYNNLELLEKPVQECERNKTMVSYCRERAVIDQVNLYPGFAEDLTARSEGCLQNNTRSLFQELQAKLTGLLIDIELKGNQTEKADIAPVNEALRNLSFAVGAGSDGENCNNSPSPAWPDLPSGQSVAHAKELAASAIGHVMAVNIMFDNFSSCDPALLLHDLCEGRVITDELNLYPGFSNEIAARSEECFPENTGEYITYFQTDMMSARYYLDSKNETADQETLKQVMAGANELIDTISEAMGLGRNGEQCHDPLPQAWPNMPSNDSTAIAREFLDTAEKEMDDVWHLVRDCNRADAVQKFCESKALVDNVNLYPGFLGQLDARS